MTNIRQLNRHNINDIQDPTGITLKKTYLL
jgi:hypothetical protein